MSFTFSGRHRLKKAGTLIAARRAKRGINDHSLLSTLPKKRQLGFRLLDLILGNDWSESGRPRSSQA